MGRVPVAGGAVSVAPLPFRLEPGAHSAGGAGLSRSAARRCPSEGAGVKPLFFFQRFDANGRRPKAAAMALPGLEDLVYCVFVYDFFCAAASSPGSTRGSLTS